MTEDGKLRIVEQESEFLFSIANTDGQSYEKRQVGEGVEAQILSTSSVVGALLFDKTKWKLEDVTTYLTSQGFEPSDLEQAKFEAEEETELRLEAFEFEIDATAELQGDDGQELLKFSAKAITTGEHKGFKFERGVLEDAVATGLYDEARVVEHHRFEEPAHVVGWLTSAKMGTDGPEVDGNIFAKQSIEKVRSGQLHSVSSNFLLRTGKDKLVTKITKVVELTLTHIPADESAVITSNREVALPLSTVANLATDTADIQPIVSISLSEKSPPISEASGGNCLTETEQPGNTETSVSEVSSSAQFENAQVELENRVAQLEEKLKAEADEKVKLQNDIATMAEQKKLELADQKAKQLVLEGKILPSAQNSVEALYATFSVEQEKMWHEYVKTVPNQVEFQKHGIPLSDKPPVFDPRQAEALLLEKIQGEWEKNGGDGPVAQRQHLSPAGFGPGYGTNTIQTQFHAAPEWVNPAQPQAPVPAQVPVPAPVQTPPMTQAPPEPEGVREIKPPFGGSE